jgi:hypothetical protein
MWKKLRYISSFRLIADIRTPSVCMELPFWEDSAFRRIEARLLGISNLPRIKVNLISLLDNEEARENLN